MERVESSANDEIEPHPISPFSSLFAVAGFMHNPYNGVICNDTITATGVFGSKELWRLAKGKSKDSQ